MRVFETFLKCWESTAASHKSSVSEFQTVGLATENDTIRYDTVRV